MPRKGTKRRKTRTHVKPSESSADPNAAKTPKSFVVKSGTVGHSVSALTRDVRKVLEPNTSSRLRERKSNRLRDFVSMSGPLGVTHMLVFSQPAAPRLVENPETKHKDESPEARADRALTDGTSSLNMRLIRLPRGPTLSFKVLRYSLAADVLRMARRPRSVGREFAESPMLILSGFGGEDKQLKLMTTVFQNLFPPIHVQTMALSSARRVVLLSYNATTHTIDFRHYLISVRQVGVSRPIRKLIAGSAANRSLPVGKRARSEMSDASEDSEDERALASTSAKTAGKAKGVLNLGRADDISDYILRHENMGFVTSDSEQSEMSDAASSNGGSDSEADERRGKVRLAADYVGRGNRGRNVRGEKRAVRLVELGPRMELGLVKIEEGVGEGEVLFHEMVHKSVKEAAELAKAHAAKRKLAAERRAEQAANVARKKAEKKARKAANGEEVEEDDEEEEDDENKIDSDIEYDYDENHGLPVPGSGDEEEVFDDEDSQFEDEDEEMAGDSDAFDDEDDELEQPEWNGEDDDSDLEPIPLGQAEEIGSADGSDVDGAGDSDSSLDLQGGIQKLPPRKGGNKPASSATGFKQKGFKKQDRGEAPRAIGIARERGLTKKALKREQEAERRSGKKDEWKGRFEAGDKEGQKEREAGKAGRGGRGGARGGGGGRGGGRGGRGRGGK